MPKVTLVGRLVGVHGAVIGRYERDDVKPSIEIAKAIADSLGVSVDYLVGEEGQLSNYDKDVLKRIEAIVNMDSEDRKTVFKIVYKMLITKKFNTFFQENLQK